MVKPTLEEGEDASYYNYGAGGNGGSGIVIIRYTI
jgi:hypothetical protein